MTSRRNWTASTVTDALAEFLVGVDLGAEEWQERALCAQTDPEAFYPEQGQSAGDAKRVCSLCPVRTECLKYAVEHDEGYGIWGGLSEKERREFRDRGPQPVWLREAAERRRAPWRFNDGVSLPAREGAV